MTFSALRDLGFKLAQYDGLTLISIERNPKGNVRGLCHGDGRIFIRQARQQAMYPEIRQQEDLRTLVHEVAHLKFMNHEQEFWDYTDYLCQVVEKLTNIKVKPEVRMMRIR